jgi:hypothetical protein
MWYVEVLVKTMPRRKCPWGATKQVSESARLRIELFTTPSTLSSSKSVLITCSYTFSEAMGVISRGLFTLVSDVNFAGDKIFLRSTVGSALNRAISSL